ncbi:diguanylate cyclase [Afipia sp. Root123D2]|uniref:GGDEF domain-containing protein n=1 Tax=Afipia sp. Root123D2 TaxID=1736436 RepID=UPI0006FC8AB5|nr:GGDEF domain-containing protein [Afipia sp. Root123D2]KQW20559.1 diguanylate cyclase [Afipia sp. Root123D2]
MLLDQFSVLIAIGFSGASLGLTLFMMWIVGRAETHLLNWSIGLAFLVLGVVLFGSVVEKYDATILSASFSLLIVGFGLLYAGSAKFCSDQANWPITVAIVTLSVATTVIAFATGYSGIGTIAGNTLIGVLLIATARQYWAARAEAPLLMTANATLYFIVSASFIMCGYALASQGQFILTSRPANWAEDINSIVVIVGLTGIGTLSLTLNQTRIANRHKREAMTDALTGLLNRRALLENPQDNVPMDTALVAMDLDHFKAINDRFGHDSGDQTLKAFAGLIRANIRTTDLAARIGGEEFCIVLSNSNPRTSAAIAERIRAQIEAMPIPTSSGSIRTTVSAGIAYSTGAETIQSLLIRADEALYEAKAAGRNRVKTSGLSLAA